MTNALVAGVVVSGTYVLVALGFALVLRVADIVNLAHGSVVVGGMYLGIIFVNDFGLPYYASVPLAVLVGLVPALIVYETLLRVAKREGHRPQIVYTILLLNLLQVIYQMGFGPDFRTLDIESHAWTIFGVAIRQEQVVSFVVAVVVCSVLFLVFRFTALGKSVEAAGKYREAAESIGLPVERLYRVVFATGTAMALLAGVMIVSWTPVTPFLGIEYLVIAVLVAIAARLSFAGCVIAALVYGVGYQVLVYLFTDPVTAGVATYGVFLVLIGATPAARSVWVRARTASQRRSEQVVRSAT